MTEAVEGAIEATSAERVDQSGSSLRFQPFDYLIFGLLGMMQGKLNRS